jgi:hypothetical protein
MLASVEKAGMPSIARTVKHRRIEITKRNIFHSSWLQFHSSCHSELGPESLKKDPEIVNPDPEINSG